MVFFRACAEEDWDEFFECRLVPYEIKLKDGTLRKHNPAVRNDTLLTDGLRSLLQFRLDRAELTLAGARGIAVGNCLLKVVGFVKLVIFGYVEITLKFMWR